MMTKSRLGRRCSRAARLIGSLGMRVVAFLAGLALATGLAGQVCAFQGHPARSDLLDDV